MSWLIQAAVHEPKLGDREIKQKTELQYKGENCVVGEIKYLFYHGYFLYW